MIFITVNLHALHNFVHLAIDAYIKVTFTSHGLKEFAIMSFTTMNQWGQKENLLALIVVEYHLDNTLFCILYHFLTRGIAVGFTSTGIK